MVMELWSGWFDLWGGLHHLFPAEGKTRHSKIQRLSGSNDRERERAGERILETGSPCDGCPTGRQPKD